MAGAISVSKHLMFIVEDLEAQGAKIISPAKPMNAGTRILAFIEDPDGYVVELNEKLDLTQ